MAINQITYTNKSYINQNSGIADTNKVNDSDMNEIKSVVNANATILGDSSNLTSTDVTTAIKDLMGDVLYETNSPSTGNKLTLSKSIANYKRIVIYAWDSEVDNHYTTEVYNNGSSTITFTMQNGQANYGSGSYTAHLTLTNVSISNTTLTKGYRTYVNVSQNAVQSQTATGGTSNSSRIQKIVGYKY